MKSIMFVVGLVVGFMLSFSFYNPVTSMVTLTLQLPELPRPQFVAKIIDHKELRCLQENIFFEARNQVPAGQAMVGIVTVERTRMSGYPSTICGVVHDRDQFSWTKTPHKVNLSSKGESYAWWLAGLIAQNIMVNSDAIDTDYRNLAYYHSTSVNPRWAKASNIFKEFTIGDHVFYSKVGNESLALR